MFKFAHFAFADYWQSLLVQLVELLFGSEFLASASRLTQRRIILLRRVVVD